MKTWFLLSIFCLTGITTVFAKNNHATDHPAVHGMVLFGKTQTYLSHLPMFHSPHNYQVILEVQLDADSLSDYHQDLKNPHGDLYTLVPEVFVLPDLIQNPKAFKAQIFRGHFERGGVELLKNVKVEIKRVLYFKKLDPNAHKPSSEDYLWVGSDSEQFLIHTITAKPDFDQIVSVYPVKSQVGLIQKNGFLNVSFKKDGSGEELPTSGIVFGETQLNRSPHKFKILGSPYLEWGDLAH